MTREVDSVIRQLDDFVERVVRDLSRNTTTELTDATPKDTAFASVNWIPRVGADNADPPALTRSFESATTIRVQQQAALASLSAYQLAQGLIYIPNNVTYIVNLNQGSSEQAPSAFVQTAIAAAINNTVREFR